MLLGEWPYRACCRMLRLPPAADGAAGLAAMSQAGPGLIAVLAGCRWMLRAAAHG
ncbi:hypothetical protein [Kribbella sp. NPDC000426]|uniref:hypothetical protein n=1 Tax=Kribbella sp. NPDC000426 TaxID=3154255 RepID=UPI00332CBE94